VTAWRSVAAGALALAGALVPPVASGAEEAEPGPEERYEALLLSWEDAWGAAAGVDSAAADPAVGEVTLLEAETLALVAAELMEEGDPDLAVLLLHDALELLGSGEPDPPDSSRSSPR
jgi:hypothetical protein